MIFLFNNKTKFEFDKDLLDLIKKVILQTLIYENFSQDIEISFTIVYNKEIKKLNFDFRNIDKETDVLSFPLLDFPIKNLDKNAPIGDIIISIEKAIEQAKTYEHTLERELCFLTVHSMLHLLGYDHQTKDEEDIMFKKQEDILNSLNIKR